MSTLDLCVIGELADVYKGTNLTFIIWPLIKDKNDIKGKFKGLSWEKRFSGCTGLHVYFLT